MSGCDELGLAITSDAVEHLELEALAVDAVVGDVFDMEAAIFDMGMENDVEELAELSLLTSVHAVAPKAKAESVAALDTLNQGMLELKLSGEWFRVLSAHLNAQN